MYQLRRIILTVFASCAAAVMLAGLACASDLDISARSAIVMDAATGEVIITKNQDMKLPPASTTKVMTAILAIENAKLTDKFKVSKKASMMEPSKVNLLPGDRVSLEALLYSILLKSANDAAAVIAEGIGGSADKFAGMMTRRARELGATRTNFKNASGLPARDHYSTAYDLALIFRCAMGYDLYRDIASTKHATLHLGGNKDVVLKNSNKLLWLYDGAVAGKTGYTRAARDCYVGMAKRGGRELIVAVLKSEQRWSDVRQLLDKGFELSSAGATLAIDDRPGGSKTKLDEDARTGLGSE